MPLPSSTAFLVFLRACRLRVPGAAFPLLALLGLSGCVPDRGAETPAEPPAVGVLEVSKQKVNPFFEFVGKTRAAETVALRARVTGFLEERTFEEGGQVEVEEVLFRIEPEQYQATMAQAQAELGAAEASLNRAQVDLARYRELAKAKNVSQQKVDEAQAEVLVQEAAVETAKAGIQKAQLNLDYTEIRSPIKGRIDVAAYDVGNLIGPDSGVLATINLMDPIKVAFSIAETWYLELVKADVEAKRGGDAAEDFSHVPLIRLPDGSMYQQRGRFDFIDNKVDEKTGTVLIRAEFPNPDRLLLPGQFVTVVIEREQAIDAVMIPQAAVLTDQGGTYVLLVDEADKVEARRIETGQRFGPNLVVKEGLAPADRIVLYGIQKVRPGIQVKPELAAAPDDPMDNATSGSSLDQSETEQPAATAAQEGTRTEARAVSAEQTNTPEGAPGETGGAVDAETSD